MLKRKYIKRAYVEVPYCDKCGAEMRYTGIVLDTYPQQYPYTCSNENCDGHATFFSTELPNQIKYEFEEDEEDV